MFPLFPLNIWKTTENTNRGHLEKFSFPVAKNISPLNQFSFTFYAKCRQIFSFTTKKRYFVSFPLFYHPFFRPFWPPISGCRDTCLPKSVSTSLQKSTNLSFLPSTKRTHLLSFVLLSLFLPISAGIAVRTFLVLSHEGVFLVFYVRPPVQLFACGRLFSFKCPAFFISIIHSSGGKQIMLN